MKKLTDAKLAVLIFVLGVSLFTLGLGDREFIRIHARYGRFIQEMERTGLTLHPTLYGEPYPDYLSTHAGLMWFSTKIFGGLNFFAAVFPTAVASALTLALVYLIGATRSRKLGAAAALLFLMTTEIVMEARSPGPDPFIMAITTFCFYFLLVRGEKSARWTSILPLCPLLVVGYAFRGPIGVVVPSAVIIVFHLLSRHYRTLIVSGAVCGATLVACFAAQWRITIWEYGRDYAMKVLNAQVLCRIQGPSPDDISPFYFYFVYGLYFYALAFPLALLTIGWRWKALLRDWRSEEVAFLRLLAGWLLIVMVGLSVPALKHTRYVIPAIPAAALLAAFVFVHENAPRPFETFRRLLSAALLFAPAVAFVAIPIADFSLKNAHGYEAAGTGWMVMAIVGALISAFLAARALKGGQIDSLKPLAYGAVGYLVAHVAVIEVAEQAAETSRPFVALAETARKSEDPVVFWQIGPDGDDVKYALYARLATPPTFISGGEEELAAETGASALIVARAKAFDALSEAFRAKCAVIARGELGHRDCVAFRKVK